MRLPKYMLTCNFCQCEYLSIDLVNRHWEVCPTRVEYNTKSDFELHHTPFRDVRNLAGEVVFATEWKKLMETIHDLSIHDDETMLSSVLRFLPEHVTQHHASLAASLIVWLGTNCGTCFLGTAKRIADSKAFISKSDAYLAAWSVENKRDRGINSGGRMTEHFMYGNLVPEDRQPPPASVEDYEVLDRVAQWLGSDDGHKFLLRCERIIFARQKGLSDRDLEKLGVLFTHT